MKIAILTTDSRQEDSRLAEAAAQRGHSAEILTVQKCSIGICNKQPQIFFKGKDVSTAYDIVIPRINIPYTQHGLAILRQFQAMGVHTTDVAHSLEMGRDKLRCKQHLIQNDVPTPKTGYAYSQSDYDMIIESVGGPPLILKLIEGTEGTGVFLARDEKEARNILSSFKQFDARIIVQEFIEESAGMDLRCFVVGGRVIASMRRESQDGDFRANVALGAKSFSETVSGEEEETVLKAAKSIGINIAGVDVIRSKRGSLIIEINVSPDFCGESGLEATSGVDVAGAIIDFAVAGKEEKTLTGR